MFRRRVAFGHGSTAAVLRRTLLAATLLPKIRLPKTRLPKTWLARTWRVAVVLVAVLSNSRTARATGDVTPLLYVYLGVNGGFAAYDVATAALREKNDVVLGGQLAIAGIETTYISLGGY